MLEKDKEWMSKYAAEGAEVVGSKEYCEEQFSQIKSRIKERKEAKQRIL